MSINEKIHDLKRKLATLKGKATRFKNHLDGLSNKPVDVNELKLRLNKFEPCLTQFEDIYYELQGETKDENTTDLDEFEDRYYRLISTARSYISEPQVSKVNDPVKLPRLNLPVFDGKYENWLLFYDTFSSVIDKNTNLSAIQRFQYLRSSLSNEALEVIQSLELSAANYDIAWNLLKERFQNTKLITSTHMKALFNITPVQKENFASLRQLLDNVLKHLRALKSLEHPTDTWDAILIYLVTTKLDHLTLKEWESSSYSSTDKPKMDDLITFLQSRCQVLETVQQSYNHRSNDTTPNIQDMSKNRTRVTLQTSQQHMLRPEIQIVSFAKSHMNYLVVINF